MKKIIKLKYKKYLLQELTIPGSKTYYQITKGKQKLATFTNEEEANGNFDHLVMHGSLKDDSSWLNEQNKVNYNQNDIQTYKKDGYEVLVFNDEFQIVKDDEVILEGDAGYRSPREIYYNAKKNKYLA